MSRNGAGVYSLPGTYEATPGETILAAQHNDPLEDLQQDANTPRPVVAGGTGSTTEQGAIDAFFATARTIKDDKLLIVDPADTTKRARLDAGNVTAGQTRVLKSPDRDGTVVVDGVFGQCLLAKDSSNLKLTPFKGNLVTDGSGKIYSVPSAGVTLAATSATPGTTYNIFAYDSDADGVIDTLERVTTGVTVASNGVSHKTGATDRIFVGAAIPDTGPAWVDSDTKRYVRSWFNEPPMRFYASLGSNTNVSNSSFTKISTALDCAVLLFDGERILATMTGFMWSSGSVATTGVGVGIDTSSAPQAVSEETPNTATGSMAFGVTAISDALVAGSHAITGCGRTAGTSVFAGATSVHGTVLRRAN